MFNNIIGAIGTVQTLVSAVVAIIVGVIWGLLFFRRERRIFKNLRRSIGIISTPETTMDHEYKLIRRAGLFKVTEPSSDNRAIDLMQKHRLIIIAYSNSADFKTAYDRIRHWGIPVIIYAKFGDIPKEEFPYIEKYTNHTICNTPLRLISDVFAIMSTYPEDE
jgi:hypothetical protein